MTKEVKKYLDYAKHDKEFNTEMELFDTGFRIPNFFTSELDKHLYVSWYIGWRCGKGYGLLKAEDLP